MHGLGLGLIQENLDHAMCCLGFLIRVVHVVAEGVRSGCICYGSSDNNDNIIAIERPPSKKKRHHRDWFINLNEMKFLTIPIQKSSGDGLHIAPKTNGS